MDKTYWFARETAARSRDSGDRNRQMDSRVRKSTERHGFCGYLAYSSVTVQNRFGHTDHNLLGGIAVGDESTVEYIGRSRYFRECRGKEAPGTGFSRSDLDLPRSANNEQCLSLRDEIRVHAPLLKGLIKTITRISRSKAGEVLHWRRPQCLRAGL